MDERTAELNYCQAGGLLVGDEGVVPGDPTEYGGAGLPVAVGCSRLQCRVCHAWVRNAPGLKPQPGTRAGELHRAPDWSKAPTLVTRTEIGAGRLYACTCTTWVEALRRVTDDPDPEEPTFSWRCQGHPRVTLPCEVDGVRIAADMDFAKLVRSVLSSGAPAQARPGERKHALGWLQKLYVRVCGTSAREGISRAMAELLTDPDAAARGHALLFFGVFEEAEGIERLVEAGHAHPELFPAGLEDPTHRKYTMRERFQETLGLHLREARRPVAGALELARAQAMAGPAQTQLYLALVEKDPAWLEQHAGDVARVTPAAWQGLLVALSAVDSDRLEPIVRALVERDAVAADDLRAFARSREGVNPWASGKMLEALGDGARLPAMSSDFPHFDQRVPMDAARSWTATFDSHDQRNEDCYYVVTLFDGDREVTRFMAQVGLYRAGDDWSTPRFVDRLRRELGDVAAGGKTNTTYQGSLAGWLARRMP